MRILILANYFPPEIGAASYLFYDLAESLADDGHVVTVVTPFPRYRMGGTREKGIIRRDRVGRSTVVRVASSPFDTGGPLKRGLDHLYLAPSLFAGGLLADRPDVVFIYSPPLTLGAAAWALARLRRIPYVVNVQDLFPQYAIDVGLMRNPLLIKAFEALERFVYRTADALTINSPGCRCHLLSKGAPQERVHVLSNWIDVDLIRPGTRNNEFRGEYAAAGEFVVQYAGTMGYQQDLDTVLEAAHLLRHEPNLRFLLVGDGVERERLESKARQLDLRNVDFVPFQPRERYPLVVQAADACVVALRKEVRTPAIPSKLLGIMAAGKPVLISANPDGDAPAMVAAVGCGLSVPPGEPTRFAEAVLALKQAPGRARDMGRRGRRYAEREFSRRAAATRCEELFAEAVLRHRASGDSRTPASR